MSIRYRLLPDEGLVHLEISGSVSLADIIILIAQLRSEPGYYPLHFMDITGISVNLKFEDIRHLASVLGTPSGTNRSAILAANDFVYGLCRQLQAIRGGQSGRVFRTREAALDYLEIEEVPSGGEWKTVHQSGLSPA
jgi:hypothetical protein